MEMVTKNKGTEDLPFGKILRTLMKERHLTLKQVADLADVSVSTVQNWCEGKNPHDLKAVAKLAQKLGINFKEMLIGEPESNRKSEVITDIFDEKELFDGICKVTIKRLVPKKSE